VVCLEEGRPVAVQRFLPRYIHLDTQFSKLGSSIGRGKASDGR
jgi:hypothetical protein